MKHESFARVLAIYLHPRHFGYVVVENPDKLLDWGVRSHRRKGISTDILFGKLRSLLELWSPSLLVVNGPPQVRPHKSLHRTRLFERVLAEAKNHRVSVCIGSDQVGSLTKHENARRAAEHFSVLRWNLPPKRKPWESEDYRMNMFTAAGLAMAYLDIPVPRP